MMPDDFMVSNADAVVMPPAEYQLDVEIVNAGDDCSVQICIVQDDLRG